MNLIVITLAVLGFAIALAYLYGKGKAEKKQAEKDADALLKANDIASKPYVDNPVDSLLQEDK